MKLLYATQMEPRAGAAGASPIPAPLFMFFVNDPSLLTDTYRKYLENKLREALPFPGLPIRFKLRGREPKESIGKTKN